MLSVKMLNTEYRTPNGAVVRAAQDVSFEVPKGKFFTLLGPSGCGKTTTLRSIAGLERPVSGDIEVNGHVVYSSSQGVFVPPNKRNFGMVFQSYAIWPHMTVFANAAFPLQVRKDKPNKQQIRDKVERVLAAVQLDHLAGRDATRLSGGQQQRLALARALVMEPELLLLDEPLSNLDAKLREAMRFELKRIQRDNGLTTIYVTHDQSEALAMSHEIAVMSEGRIVQIGTPREIYEQPQNRFVAAFIGKTNFIDGVVQAGAGDQRASVETALGVLHVRTVQQLAAGTRVAISIRPEDIMAVEAAVPSSAQVNTFTGTVDATVFLGDIVDLRVKTGDVMIEARSHPALGVSEGDTIHLQADASKCLAIPGEAAALAAEAAAA